MSGVRPPLNIVIADTRTLWRQALGRTIEGMTDGIRVKEHAGMAGVDRLVANERGDGDHLVIVGIDPRDSEQLETLRRTCTAIPDVPVVVVADADSLEDILSVLEAGARGYLPTALGSRVMVEALRLVSAGGIYIPEAVLRLLSGYDRSRVMVDQARERLDDLIAECTPRQQQVLDLLCEGKANKLIAMQLNISENTVKAHLRQIMKRLRVSNRTEAVLLVSGLLAERGGANGQRNQSASRA